MCKNFHCKDHEDQLEDYTLHILEAIEAAGHECLPSSKLSNSNKTKNNKVPGWTDFVKPYAADNKFWSEIWRSQGRPKYGACFEYMKHARKQYTYAVRRLKRCNDIIRC